MRLIFAPLATADLEEIGDCIALDNPPGRYPSSGISARSAARFSTTR
jgi:plasmid stabilization system protein ParE